MRARFAVPVLSAIFFSLVLSASSACASPRGRIYVRVGPPAPIVEVRAVAPAPGHVWIDGYHRWNSHAYVWVPGRWSAPSRPRAVWVPAHWVHERRGWYFVEGYWR